MVKEEKPSKRWANTTNHGADVAAVAGPASGEAVYDSYGGSGGANWFVFGATSSSASTPWPATPST